AQAVQRRAVVQRRPLQLAGLEEAPVSAAERPCPGLTFHIGSAHEPGGSRLRWVVGPRRRCRRSTATAPTTRAVPATSRQLAGSGTGVKAVICTIGMNCEGDPERTSKPVLAK